MARVVQFHKTGGPEVLQIDEVDLPAPAGGEVQVRVHAIGLNRAEVMYRSGQYLEEPKYPSRLGYEASGTVEAVGAGVTDYKAGDVVSVVPSFSMNEYGTYADLANLPVHALARHPESLSWEEGAAVWMMFATAYGALIDIGKLVQGDTVLIPAASSSVGLAAIQICRMVGATPIALTRNSDKSHQLREAGAEHVIVTSEQDIADETKKFTGGKGAQIAFDPVGGPTVEQLADALAPGGILFQYGALSTEPTPLPLLQVLGKTLTVRGYLLFEITQEPDRLNSAKEFIIGGLESGKLKPAIAKTFPLEQIVEAHRYMESNQQIGKIVVTVD